MNRHIALSDFTQNATLPTTYFANLNRLTTDAIAWLAFDVLVKAKRANSLAYIKLI